MKYKNWNAKRDANEKEIVHALESIGCQVHRLNQPIDLLVGYRGQTHLMEVKTAKGKLEKSQQEFFRTWNGQAPAIVHTAEEAIAIVTNAGTR